ncbi:type VI secretion system tube protein Hcp [Rheinheimera sp. 4Y26]|uniref:Hcp family type VI secretion system effector n=1 Tax=Rheinheimera sp. 4Y26 TaxID=2977811 RepID=UPI0028BEA9E4|nr:type VI secretion system tube protein Hcp [Rheinheimera sp. 4Y26]
MKTGHFVAQYVFTIATATTLLITPITASAAVDMFLKIEGIPGETTDKANIGSVDILAWSEGLSQSGTTHLGGGAGAGKVNVQDISFTKYLDSSSPVLRQYISSGSIIPSAILTVRSGGEIPQVFFKIEMKNILISSVSAGGSGGEDRLTENLTLNFAEVRWTYIKPNGAEVTAGWNIPENKPL